ncbi:MAG: CoA transferase, partial [Pseudomonadota bacterium]
AVATTGDVDTPPLKTFGELNFMVSGVYVAIAALAALFSADASGTGQKAEISVHECIASCLEQVFMFYCYSDLLQRPEGKVLPRRGALHWSDAYTVMNGKNGSIMITPAPDFDAQLAWLIEEGVHDDLLDPKYSAPENMRDWILRMMEILTQWVAQQDVETLFFAAQDRHAPYGWVMPIEKVADNPQLDARRWYVPYRVGNQEIQAPGAPYQFSETGWGLDDYSMEVLNDIGWQSAADTTTGDSV